MAESQLEVMEDGQIVMSVPESRPEFYYSEQQRAALEELLKNGDCAFKTRLDEDKFKDFLSAREIRIVRSTFVEYKTDENNESNQTPKHADDSESLRSTYWPQLSETKVPGLDIGWPSGASFRGGMRVEVYTHPPKENGPHIKEVVRRLIQEARKMIAIVMDFLTDLQILQDLLDASSKRCVPVYILLDDLGSPHFLDMCNRLKVGSHQLRYIRTRTVKGVGFDLSFGRIPGSLCNKYMIIDGDKVLFGSFSFSWISSRMDRNMITVMSGQIVDFFEQDFRELYAISEELNLYKEFSISEKEKAVLSQVTVPRRPSLPAKSRFQVSLGAPGTLKVPAHKYHNPKYLLALGNLGDDSTTLQEMIDKMQLEKSHENPPIEENPIPEDYEKPDIQTQLPSKEKGTDKKTWKKTFSFQRSKSKGVKNNVEEASQGATQGPSSKSTEVLPNGMEDIKEEPEPTGTKNKNKKKKSTKQQTVNEQEDQDSGSHKDSKKGCSQS